MAYGHGQRGVSDSGEHGLIFVVAEELELAAGPIGRDVRWGQPTSLSRDWNWHTVTGFWCAIPLLVIVSCGVFMSFPWATNLLYRATGENPPAEQQRDPGPAPGQAGSGAKPGRGTRRGGGERGRQQGDAVACNGWDFDRMDAAWNQAAQKSPEWQTITLRLAPSGKTAAFTIDQGNGGRPDLRSQWTVDLQTGESVRWEPFSSYGTARRLRTWMRFTHTGEDGGGFGETIAALATLSVVVLAPTGLAMAWRRVLRKRAGALAGKGRGSRLREAEFS
jgi:uncharacterized iron-regulated membrane protein